LLKWETLRQAKATFKNPRRCLRNMSGDRYDEIASDEDALARISKLTVMSLECARRPSGIENDWAMLVADAGVVEYSIQCPTLIIHDRADPLVPFAHAEWSHGRIDNSRLLDVHAGGHLIWFGRDYPRLHRVRVDFVRQAVAA
jgi:pimeloyl-ACP methyl ester carboxylesterase